LSVKTDRKDVDFDLQSIIVRLIYRRADNPSTHFSYQL